MQIFDEKLRTDRSPKARSESAFGFLNRASRPEYEEIRERIERWFSTYPHEHAHDLVRRLRSNRDPNHSAAVFELFVHELLSCLGWSVGIHPTIPGTLKSPDFLATMAGERVLVEATEVRPRSSLWATDPLEDQVLDAIDRLDAPNFFLNVATGGHLDKAPPHAKVVAPFQEFMAAHDPDEVANSIRAHGTQASPAKRIEWGGWYIEVSLIPKFKLRGDGASRAIGAGPGRAGMVNDSQPVRDALRAKASRYGRTGLPLIVALNAPDVDEIDEIEALFGREQVTYTIGDDSAPPRMTRAPDGAWIGPGYRPRHTRLSAALIFRGIAPWSLGVPACLYVNPFAKHSIPKALLALPHAVHKNGELVRVAGVDVGDVVGLDPIYHSD